MLRFVIVENNDKQIKLLTTDSFAHAYQHATATIQTIKLYRAHSTLS